MLPFELERTICEYAVFESRDTTTRIIRVARRFKIWFEPELYRIVKRTELWQSPSDLDKEVYKPEVPGGRIFKTRVLDPSRIRRFGPWVHHLFLKSNRKELKAFLQHCPNVYELELEEAANRNCVDLIPLLEKLPLRKLCFEPCSFFENVFFLPYQEERPYAGPFRIPFNQPMFYGLTHLEITLYEVDRHEADYRQLVLLPRLTHLAFTEYYWDYHLDKLIDSIIPHSQQIQLLVIVFVSEWEFQVVVPESQHQNDARVVFLLDNPFGELDRELDRDRGRGKRTEKVFWRMAEAKKQEALQKAKLQ
ncbi:hypothetical protein D9613_002600 [Agrocybe pediades]|uniref:Uncharacterized protein n=1 Tax=Agrocybe pediades TaxID=84607 RepID=A0A8H4QPH5_9AGAR|nr:hypothetical protein D9613_002600 [Agrocybe pediades]